MTGSTCFYFEPVTCIKAERKKKKKLDLGLFCVFLGVAPLGCGFLRFLLELCLMREDGTGGDGNCVYAVASPNEK